MHIRLAAMNNIAPEAPVLMTQAAANRIKALAAGEGNPALMLRVAISGGGCSGFSYGFTMDSEVTGDDKVFEFFGSKMVVDEASMDLLKGSQIDYVDDLMASSFRITNPQATSTCGCGTSFSV